MRYYLYDLVNKANKPCYVGLTRIPERRTREHKAKHPRLRFRILVVGEKDYIRELEKKLIAVYVKRGYSLKNVSPGGQWCPGDPKSALTRARISAVHLGKKRSAACIARMSVAMRKKWESDAAFREKVTAANRVWTPERRANNSAAQKRRIAEQGHPNLGKRWSNKKRSAEHCESMRKAALARWSRPEHRAKFADTLKRKGLTLRKACWESTAMEGA